VKTCTVPRLLSALLIAGGVICVPLPVQSAGNQSATGPLVVFLGTGMPRPDPERQGPSLAVVANGRAYIVDAGVGLVRQAQAAYEQGIRALARDRLDIAFLTHLHSDHTLGLPDLILTPWVMRRAVPLELYGPAGTQGMVENIEKAYQQDIEVRSKGLEHANTTGYKVVVHEIQPGVVYQDANIRVTAFAVLHGSWKQAFGYRFDARGKSIVVSGDTRPAETVVQACQGCDVLIHEVYSGGDDSAYFKSFHTSASELGQIAAQARPKLLVIWHYVPLGDTNQAEMVNQVQAGFHGPIVVARDLDVVAP
jgi:ribonuclease BN (tRNA processing enzyme)